MSKIAYTVVTSILYDSAAKEWLEWLNNGHIADVMAGGAESATIVKMDEEEDHIKGTTYEIRYIFKDRETFNAYLENHAARLRREGLEKFPLSDGFKYHRMTGEILE